MRDQKLYSDKEEKDGYGINNETHDKLKYKDITNRPSEKTLINERRFYHVNGWNLAINMVVI